MAPILLLGCFQSSETAFHSQPNCPATSLVLPCFLVPFIFFFPTLSSQHLVIFQAMPDLPFCLKSSSQTCKRMNKLLSARLEGVYVIKWCFPFTVNALSQTLCQRNMHFFRLFFSPSIAWTFPCLAGKLTSPKLNTSI